jgi:hypothetical protein
VREPEAVSGIDVKFAPPDKGWIDCSMRAGSQMVEFSLSEVYDPFYCGTVQIFSDWNWRRRVIRDDYVGDFIAWLERIAAAGTGRIRIDIEHGDLVMAVVPAVQPGWVDVDVRGPADAFAMSFRIPRTKFIADFYGRLVEFWEGPTMAEHWYSWIPIDDPELYSDEPPEIHRPWPIRSRKVESFLEAML